MTKISYEQKLEAKNAVIESFEKFLVGPLSGEKEVVPQGLLNRYLCGMIFPQGLVNEDLHDPSADDNNGTNDQETEDNFDLSNAYESLQSSMGISFFVNDASRIKVLCRAASYQKSDETNKIKGWIRRPLATNEEPEEVIFKFSQNTKKNNFREYVLDGKASVNCFTRPIGQGSLVTVSLVNNQNSHKSVWHDETIPLILFQCGLSVEIIEGVLGEYPRKELGNLHQEDEELNLIYSNKKTFAIGHGCSASWQKNAYGIVDTLSAEFIPKIEVSGLTTKIDGLSQPALKALDIKFLSNPDASPDEIRKLLHSFLDEYQAWQTTQKSIAEGISSEAAGRIISKQEEALDRMRAGVNYITSAENPYIFETFKLSQLAMLIQFSWSENTKTGPKVLGEAVSPNENWSSIAENKYLWRPFQLAFQLLSIESVANDISSFRNTVDLLWFPTGGGKTEAYLAITAFEILRRRLCLGMKAAVQVFGCGIHLDCYHLNNLNVAQL